MPATALAVAEAAEAAVETAEAQFPAMQLVATVETAVASSGGGASAGSGTGGSALSGGGSGTSAAGSGGSAVSGASSGGSGDPDVTTTNISVQDAEPSLRAVADKVWMSIVPF